MTEFRIGHGYDVHRFAEGRKLILGGTEVPCDRGLLGHSDADVLLHALMDAILGALGEGDIGRHFPDTDDRYLGASSLHLLTQVKKIMDAHGASLGNADMTLILQKPKIAVYTEKNEKKYRFRPCVRRGTHQYQGDDGRTSRLYRQRRRCRRARRRSSCARHLRPRRRVFLRSARRGRQRRNAESLVTSFSLLSARSLCRFFIPYYSMENSGFCYPIFN